MGLKHGADGLAEAKVGVGDNSGTDPRAAELAASTHCPHAIGELGFAKALHRLRCAGTVHRTCLDEDAGAHVVTRREIVAIVVEQVAQSRPVEEMMMRVDDWLIGIERRLHPSREPIASDRNIQPIGGMVHVSEPSRAMKSGSSSSGAAPSGKPSSNAFSVSATRL